MKDTTYNMLRNTSKFILPSALSLASGTCVALGNESAAATVGTVGGLFITFVNVTLGAVARAYNLKYNGLEENDDADNISDDALAELSNNQGE